MALPLPLPTHLLVWAMIRGHAGSGDVLLLRTAVDKLMFLQRAPADRTGAASPGGRGGGRMVHRCTPGPDNNNS